MRKKELRIVNFTLLFVMIAFGMLTFSLSSNAGYASIVKSWFIKEPKSVSENSTIKCSNKPKLQLSSVNDKNIKMLDRYQEACQSFVSNKLMYFTGFPKDKSAADNEAKIMASKLKLYNSLNITPLVIVEPYIETGPMSYKKYLSGEYDKAVDEYFKLLKEQGVTDSIMGTWVPFPESNTPSWDNKDTEPRDFAIAVNKYLGSLKQVFPMAKGSILLNATTYEPSDLEYENGDYLSLVPYLQDIDKKLIDSVGIQGFPWVSRANTSRREIFRASEFLQPDYAIEAAQELRTRDIWFNTGSFLSKYSSQPAQKVVISPDDRKSIMSGIVDELKKVQNYQQNQYRVEVNIFAEDKTGVQEDTDWSYLSDEANKLIFIDFMTKLNELNIKTSIYDSATKD